MRQSKLTKTNMPKENRSNYFRKTWQLYAMLILPIAFFMMFKYLPIWNARIAFLDYNMFGKISTSPWNNFAHFKEAFTQPKFLLAIRNTLLLNVLDLIAGFPAPILIALVLNELMSNRVKKVTQTIIYIPHFLSWVIIAGISFQIFSSTGLFNSILVDVFHQPAIPFLTNKWSWLFTYIGIGVWQSAGYGTIIYLAALSGIDPSLYDAAYVDGAGRFRRIMSVTLPCIKGTIVVLLILQVGKLLSISFDRPYMLGNPIVSDFSEVISTYVYNVGLQSARFDYAAAVGLFQSIIAFILIVSFNALVKKMGEEGVL